MKKICTAIMLAGSLAFASCEIDTTDNNDRKCINKLEEQLQLVMLECANPAYVTSRGYADAADCRRFEGGVSLIMYYECTTEEATK